MRGDNLHNICLKYASLLTHCVVGGLPPVVELIGCSGLWLKGGGLSTQWKADIYNQPWMPWSLNSEVWNSEVYKLWWNSALKVCNQFEKNIYYY